MRALNLKTLILPVLIATGLVGLHLALLVSTAPAEAQGADPVDALLDAYGGEAAIRGVQSLEYEWVGYFHGRYQSRYTEPPYDRLPVRYFTALDFGSERGVADTISTWPGDLDMGTRTILNGAEAVTLNTISRIYTDGAMMDFAGQVHSASRSLAFVLVRQMADRRDQVARAGTEVIRGIAYKVLTYGPLRIFVHPETGLIYAMEGQAGNMTDGPEIARRYFTHYFEHDGVMINRRYRREAGGVFVSDMDLFTFDTNIDISPHLKIPDDFKHVESMDGYSGESDILVRDQGNGIYLAGDGETQILYVEFDDYFVAIEAGGMPSYAEATLRVMEPYMKAKPLRYIVPTHHHDDHAIAVHFYARNGTTILTTRDKEGFLRRLLDKTWSYQGSEQGPVEGARFEFLDGPVFRIQDKTNELVLLVDEAGPHTADMIVAYAPKARLLFSADVFIGWAGDEVRQGAGFGAHHLDAWTKRLQNDGVLGPIETWASVHGRAYSARDWRVFLSKDRTVTVLPGNDRWKTETWFRPYGLTNDTVQERVKAYAGSSRGP